jgi:TetR/AcrR family transcriptional regulator, transcriptional repressor for nem operon
MTVASPAIDVREHILEVAKPLLLRKGFTAVGLAEVLTAARVPKGSFYHYFGSKEAFGEAVLEAYFADYLARTDRLLTGHGTAPEQLIAYFEDWLESQTGGEAEVRCLAVKLGAEVSDLSESMRTALDRGTRGVVERLGRCIERGRSAGSLPAQLDAQLVAVGLYERWLGASLLAKIARDRAPLDAAMASTRQLLGVAPEA